MKDMLNVMSSSLKYGHVGGRCLLRAASWKQRARDVAMTEVGPLDGRRARRQWPCCSMIRWAIRLTSIRSACA